MLRIQIVVIYLGCLGPSVYGLRDWFYGDKILLSDIDQVVGTRGRMTNSRPSSTPVPQLQCMHGGSAGCGGFQPDVIRCYSQGGQGLNVQWKCYAVMEPGYYFGRVDVNCEGYSYHGDPYVLANSCAIRYTLNSDSYVYADSDFPSAIVLFVIVVILIVVVLIVCCRDNEPRDTNAPIVVYERPVYYDNYYNRPRAGVVYLPQYRQTNAITATTTSRGTNTDWSWLRRGVQSANATSSSR